MGARKVLWSGLRLCEPLERHHIACARCISTAADASYRIDNDDAEQYTNWKQNNRRWNSDELSHKEYFDWLGKRLGITHKSQWHRVTNQEVFQNYGRGLLRHYYNFSLYSALATAYPQHPWQPWLFDKAPQGYWLDKANHRKYFDWVASELGIDSIEKWYTITQDDIHAMGGCGLLTVYYSDSVSKALLSVYPELDWHIWKFSHAPRNFWSHDTNVKKYLGYLMSQLGIQKIDDWHVITRVSLNDHKGSYILQKMCGLPKLLSRFFPQHNWNMEKLAQKTDTKSQSWLTSIIQSMFPNTEMLLNYKHPKMMFPLTHKPIELDIYLPKLALALEYQGVQHMEWRRATGSPFEVIERDKWKKMTCEAAGITVIQIPHWWNHCDGYVKKAIYEVRPDLTTLLQNGHQESMAASQS